MSKLFKFIKVFKILLFMLFLLGSFTPLTSAQTFDECNVLKDSGRCNAETGCFWTVKNARGYCTNGIRGDACRTAWCLSGFKCNQETFSCDFQGCGAITDISTCNGAAGCFWHLSNTVARKQECVDGPRGDRVGAELFCRPNEKIDVEKMLCVTKPLVEATRTPGGGTTISCSPPNHICATEANRPAGYIYNDKEANRAALDAACGGGNVYCWTKSTSSDQTSGTATTTPATKAQYPCQFKNGVKEYVGSYCGGKSWNSTDVTKNTFCSLTYTDKYMCHDGTPDDFEPPLSSLPGGVSPCAQTPWCKTTTTTTPTPSKATGRTQGQTCTPNSKDPANPGLGDCQPGLNLECVDLTYSGSYTCQYIKNPQGTRTPFTPTPGTAGNCSDANKGNWGLGCSCVNGGCNANLNCYPGADKGSLTSGTNYCAPTNQYWCASKGVVVSDPAQCTGTATVTVTPTVPDLSYQAECPNTNADGSTNICTTSCIGFTPRPSGDQICSEFTSGLNPKCCTQNKTVGANTPTPTTAFTPATPTPTRIIYPIRPLTEPVCGSSYTTYVGGTHCSSGTECYDLYNSPSGVCAVKYSGSTCAHCAR